MPEILIRDKWNAEDIQLIIDRHRILYEKEFGFDKAFGDYVAATLKGDIERIWIAEYNNAFAGCVGIVKTDPYTAQLRWFLVETEARGLGIGKQLMNALIGHCLEHHYDRIFLWTVNTLVSAKTMYERFGFRLTEEKPETMLWGQRLIEQRWDLSLKRNR